MTSSTEALRHIVHRLGRRSHNGADLDAVAKALPSLLDTIDRLERELATARREGMEAAAEIAEAHKPERKRPLAQYDAEDREMIRVEENGEAIAASCIAAAIRANMETGK